jgi:hypothetical protein
VLHNGRRRDRKIHPVDVVNQQIEKEEDSDPEALAA